MEPVDIPELTAAAEAYVEARDARIKCSRDEDESHSALLAVLHKHKRAAYRSPDGLLVTIVPGKEKAKVRRAGEEDEGAE